MSINKFRTLTPVGSTTIHPPKLICSIDRKKYISEMKIVTIMDFSGVLFLIID